MRMGQYSRPVRPRPPRSPPSDQSPTLGIRALMNAAPELAKARGLIGARVAYKVNARGEHVARARSSCRSSSGSPALRASCRAAARGRGLPPFPSGLVSPSHGELLRGVPNPASLAVNDASWLPREERSPQEAMTAALFRRVGRDAQPPRRGRTQIQRRNDDEQRHEHKQQTPRIHGLLRQGIPQGRWRRRNPTGAAWESPGRTRTATVST